MSQLTFVVDEYDSKEAQDLAVNGVQRLAITAPDRRLLAWDQYIRGD